MGPFWLDAITSENLNNEAHFTLHVSTMLEGNGCAIIPTSD